MKSTTALSTGEILDRFVGAGDEGSDVVVELLERLFVGVDHVAGLVPGVLNVLPQVGLDGQVMTSRTGRRSRGWPGRNSRRSAGP